MAFHFLISKEVELICSGLREDEDRRDVGRRWLQQEQLWICVREAPDMLVFAIFHLQIWPTFKIRMQPEWSLLNNRNYFRQFSLNEFSLNSSSDVPPKPSKWFSGGGCFERLKLSADLSVVYNRRSDVSAARWGNCKSSTDLFKFSIFFNFLIVGQSGLIGPDGTEHGAWHRTDLHWIALIFKF